MYSFRQLKLECMKIFGLLSIEIVLEALSQILSTVAAIKRLQEELKGLRTWPRPGTCNWQRVKLTRTGNKKKDLDANIKPTNQRDYHDKN